QLDHILIVGSVNGDNTLSSFSNRPGQACWGTTSTSCSSSYKMMYSFMVAPGKEKYSTLPNQRYGIMSGTSMATPMVTGAVALLQSEWPHLKDDPDGTVEILKKSAKDLGASGVDPVYGWGLLNVARAFEPIGAAYVASGATVASGGTTLSGSSLAVSAAVPAGASIEAAVDDLVVFDDYGRDFKAAPGFVEEGDDGELMADKLSALGGALGRRHGGFALASLSASFSAAGTPQDGGYSEFALSQDSYGLTLGFGQALGGAAGLAGGQDASPESLLQYGLGLGLGPAGEDLDQGFYAGGSFELVSGLSLAAFYNESGQAPSAADADPVALLREAEEDASRLMAVQLSYEALPGVTVGANFTRLEEEAGLLGSDGEGAFALGQDGETQMAGLSLALDLDEDMRFFAFYQEAWSSGEAASGSLFGEVDDWRSRRYGVALGMEDAFAGGDWLELSLVRPLAVYSGSGEAEVPVGRTEDGQVVYETTDYDLSSSALPLELSATYLGAGGEWAPGRDYNYGLQLNWRDEDAAGGVGDGTVGVLFAVKASF
ncbi:MAG TPA: S8 family serine peptidase, partial [Kiloniellales bacterium]|nr:S8 family serine peptidase [Kiloniellales bacterium]